MMQVNYLQAGVLRIKNYYMILRHFIAQNLWDIYEYSN